MAVIVFSFFIPFLAGTNEIFHNILETDRLSCVHYV